MSTNGKPILMILPVSAFQDQEYSASRNALESSGRQVVITSTVREPLEGNMGTRVNPDLIIDEVQPEDYDGVVLIGGHGASQYWHDRKTHDLIRHLNQAGKIIAAIDRAPVALGVAGIIKDKKVTGHMSIYDKLINYGANYTGQKVERDGNIVTGEGAYSSSAFAEELKKALSGLPVL